MEFDQLLGPGLDVSLAGWEQGWSLRGGRVSSPGTSSRGEKPFPCTHNPLPPRCQ